MAGSTQFVVRRNLGPLAVALAACVVAPIAAAQGLQFHSIEVRGRLDNPTSNEFWVVGDENGNGYLDENERSGLTRTEAKFAPAGIAYQAVDVTDLEIAAIEDLNDKSPFQRINAMYPIIASGAQLVHSASFVTAADPENPTASDSVEITYGARFFSSTSTYGLTPTVGSPVSSLSLETFIESESIGPQLGAKWHRRRGRWNVSAESALSVNYLNAASTQSGAFSNLIPGQYNRPLFMAPVQYHYETTDWNIAPVAEAGVQLSYDIRPSTIGFIRCDSLFVGNQRSAQEATVFRLPSMGLTDAPGYDVTIVVGSIGVEWRR